MSDTTEDDVFYDREWSPSERTCPRCGGAVESAAWWDDPPSLGGAWIGTTYRCTSCDWLEDE